MTKPHAPWSVPVRLDDIPETGRRLELDADAAVCAAIAAAAGLEAVARLRATFDLARRGRDGVRVVGALSATVRQTCVVTLDPVENEIEEEIDLVFAPGSASTQGGDLDLTTEMAEPPEALVDGVIDLGAIATEFLILGIDPYPRKAGAVFEPPPSDDAGTHPFAALAALRGGRQRG
jgi:uncharacterized metal-binding protein YceD (DUF177 family)